MQDPNTFYDQLRRPENRLYLGVIVGLLATAAIVGCLVVYQFITPIRETTPQLVLAPKALATTTLEPIETAPAFLFSETSTLPVPKKKVKTPTARPKPKAGQSCYYSSPELNNILSPVPSGSWSPIEKYSCDNGYWEIGERDVVDRKTGGWGQDGIAEKILIKYDSAGKIADRIFIDPEGEQFSGPTN